MQDLLKYRSFWLKALVLFCWANLVAAVIWLLPHLPIPVKHLTQYLGLLAQVVVAMAGFIYVNQLFLRSHKNYQSADWVPVAMMVLGIALLWLSIAMYASSPKNAAMELTVGIIGVIIAMFGTTRVKSAA